MTTNDKVALVKFADDVCYQEKLSMNKKTRRKWMEKQVVNHQLKNLEQRLWKRYKTQLIYVYMGLTPQDAPKLKILAFVLFLQQWIGFHRQSLCGVLQLIESVQQPQKTSKFDELALGYQRIHAYLRYIHEPAIPDNKMNRGWVKFQSLLSENHGQFLHAMEEKQQQATQSTTIEESREIMTRTTLTKETISRSLSSQIEPSLKEQIETLDIENKLLREAQLEEEKFKRQMQRSHKKEAVALKSSISTLEGKIAELQSTIDNKEQNFELQMKTTHESKMILEDQIIHLKEDLQRKSVFENQLDQLRDEHKELEAERKIMVDQHTCQVDTLQDKISEITSAIQEKEQEYQSRRAIDANKQIKLQQEISKLTEQIDILDVHNKSLEFKEEESKKELMDMRGEEKDLMNNTMFKLEERINELESLIDKKEKELEAQSKTNDELKVTLEAQSTRLREECQKLVLQQKTESEKHVSELDNIRDKMSKLEAQITQLESTINEKERELEVQSKTNDESKVVLEEQIANLQEEHKKLEQDLKAETEQHEYEFDSLRDKLSKAKSIIKEKEQEYLDQKSIHVNEQIKLQQEIDQLKEQIESLDIQNQSLEIEEDDCKREMKHVHEKEISVLKGKILMLEEEISKLESTIDEKDRNFESQSKVNDESKILVEKHAQQLHEEVKRKKMLEEELIQAKEEYQKLELEQRTLVDQYEVQLETLRTEISHMNSSMEEKERDHLEKINADTDVQNTLGEEIRRLKELIRNRDMRNKSQEIKEEERKREIELIHEKEKATLVEEVSTLKGKNTMLQSMIDAKKQDFELQLKSNEESRIALEDQIRQLEEVVESKSVFEEEMAEWRKKYQDLDLERESMVNNHERQLDCLRDEISQATSIVQEKEQEYLNRRSLDSNKQIRLQQEIHQLRCQIETLEICNQSLETKEAEYKEEMKDVHKKETAALEERITILQEEVTNLESTVSERDRNFESQSKPDESKMAPEERIHQLQEEVEENAILKEQIIALQEKCKKIEAERSSLQEKEHSEKHTKLRDEISQLEEQIEHLHSQNALLKTSKIEEVECKNEIKSLQEELAVLRGEIAKLEAIIDEKDRTLDLHSKTIHESKVIMEEKIRQLEEEVQTKSGLEEQIRQMREQQYQKQELERKQLDTLLVREDLPQKQAVTKENDEDYKTPGKATTVKDNVSTLETDTHDAILEAKIAHFQKATRKEDDALLEKLTFKGQREIEPTPDWKRQQQQQHREKLVVVGRNENTNRALMTYHEQDEFDSSDYGDELSCNYRIGKILYNLFSRGSVTNDQDGMPLSTPETGTCSTPDIVLPTTNNDKEKNSTPSPIRSLVLPSKAAKANKEGNGALEIDGRDNCNKQMEEEEMVSPLKEETSDSLSSCRITSPPTRSPPSSIFETKACEQQQQQTVTRKTHSSENTCISSEKVNERKVAALSFKVDMLDLSSCQSTSSIPSPTILLSPESSIETTTTTTASPNNFVEDCCGEDQQQQQKRPSLLTLLFEMPFWLFEYGLWTVMLIFLVSNFHVVSAEK